MSKRIGLLLLLLSQPISVLAADHVGISTDLRQEAGISVRYQHKYYVGFDISSDLKIASMGRVFRRGKFYWLTGISYNTGSTMIKKWNFETGFGYTWKSIDFRLSHHSNASTGSPNYGVEMLSITKVFE